MKKILFLIYFALGFSCIVFGQQSSKTDSTATEYKLKNADNGIMHVENFSNLSNQLSLLKYSISPGKFNVNFYTRPSLFLNREFDLNSHYSRKNLRTSFNSDFQFYNKSLNKKYDIGIAGPILKYVSTAAAFGLAGYHIHKYYIKKDK